MDERDKQIQELRAALHDCRNDYCEVCGRYREAHLGACDSCRWRFDGKWASL